MPKWAGLALIALVGTWLPAAAQSTYNPPTATDPAHFHQAYPSTRYGISCPHDRVVWVNTNTGVYHLEGERWFGRTKEGQYECEKAAIAEGDRETRNGQ